MNKFGQLAGYEALLIIILLGTCGYVTFLWAHKPSEANVYATGSKPTIFEMKPAPFSCARVGLEKGWTDAITSKIRH